MESLATVIPLPPAVKRQSKYVLYLDVDFQDISAYAVDDISQVHETDFITAYHGDEPIVVFSSRLPFVMVARHLVEALRNAEHPD